MSEEIKKFLKTEKPAIGTKSCIDYLKKGKLEKIFVTSNCPKTVKEDIMHYAKLSGAKIENISSTNEELGVICKKPFSISVLGILKKE
jgi:large subunit ribosomal protein L30e